mgnify:CR=1 FL=1
MKHDISKQLPKRYPTVRKGVWSRALVQLNNAELLAVILRNKESVGEKFS